MIHDKKWALGMHMCVMCRLCAQFKLENPIPNVKLYSVHVHLKIILYASIYFV